MKTQTKKQLLETMAAMDETEARRFKNETKAKIQEWIVENADQAETPDEAETKNMSKTMNKYREGYEPSISASSRKSLNCGDEVAHMLAGLDPITVVQVAEAVLGFEGGELVAKYANLNHGQQRMNAGNRIRSAVKRGDITVKDLEKVMH